jgi:1,4-dihydroxy-2-naphthoate octaprenyltransferase
MSGQKGNSKLKQVATTGGRLQAWLNLSRLPFHSVGVLPFLLGVVIAWSEGNPIRWDVFALSTLAVILIMLATYYGGEYYDYETDSINVDYNKFSGGTRVLLAGLVPKSRVLAAAYVCLLLAVVIGLALQFYYQTGPYTIPLGAFGLVCGYFYTARPAQWSYRGIGEILIGICYGWLTVNAAYYLQTGHFSLTATLVSMPIAISIFLVILINEFPDYSSDKISGKRNLVVRFGREKMATWYMSLILACFLAIIVGLFYGVPRLSAVLSILVLFLVMWNIKAIRKRGFENREVLEGLCARTFFLNLLISGIYMVTFALGG